MTFICNSNDAKSTSSFEFHGQIIMQTGDVVIWTGSLIGFRFDDFVEIWFRFMKRFHWFKQTLSNGKLERRLSLGEYKRAILWSKYLVSSSAAIKGDGEEEWSVDMSQLLIRNKFASERHNRFYRGVYKQRDVAINLTSQPEEDRGLANLVEKQFTSEVASLFRLHHSNN